jgi:hypothetical protein
MVKPNGKVSVWVPPKKTDSAGVLPRGTPRVGLPHPDRGQDLLPSEAVGAGCTGRSCDGPGPLRLRVLSTLDSEFTTKSTPLQCPATIQ